MQVQKRLTASGRNATRQTTTEMIDKYLKCTKVLGELTSSGTTDRLERERWRELVFQHHVPA